MLSLGEFRQNHHPFGVRLMVKISDMEFQNRKQPEIPLIFTFMRMT